MYKTRILIVDDDLIIRRYLHILFKSQGFDVYEARTAEVGLNQIMDTQPDLVLTDLHLPDTTGIDLMRAIHQTVRIPVVMLSDRDEAVWKVEALNAGAEDYIVKPFNVDELLARIRVALRRVRIVGGNERFSYGDLSVDFVRRLVMIGDERIELTRTEYNLLRSLIIHADEPVTYQQLWQAMRTDNEAMSVHSVRVHVSNLRHKLEREPTLFILTETGVGYRFQTKPVPLSK